jgi:hypothetical protein
MSADRDAAPVAAEGPLMRFWTAYRAVQDHETSCTRCIKQIGKAAPDCAEWRGLAIARTTAEHAVEVLVDE